MDILALCISVVSLILSFAAYRRSSGTRHDPLERASDDKAERLRSTAQSSTGSRICGRVSPRSAKKLSRKFAKT